MNRAARAAVVGLLLFTACSPAASTKGGTGGAGTGTGSGGGNPDAGSGGANPGTGSGGAGTSSGGAGPGTASGGAGTGTGSGGAGTGIGSGGAGTVTGSGGAGTATGGGAGTGTGSGGAAGAGAGGTNTGGASSAGASGACMPAIAVGTGTAATVAVNLASVKATVGADMMGIHTSVYDATMQSPMTPDLLKQAGVTSLRYPGGSYADLYHWEKHTGTPTPASGAGSNEIYVAPGADFGSFVGLLDRAGAKGFITVNYGMNPAGTGPGVPQEAAAWVAYANGSASSTTVIGKDVDGVDWMTVGYWAALRGATPLATDDGKNFLRIGRTAPVGIKYWEVGNEIYGNGYYYGNANSAGWEADLHAPYNGTNGTARAKNAALGPATYGMNVKAYAMAMKAVDPTIQVGAVLHWPLTEFTAAQGVTDWNNTVLPQACGSIDFVVNHWYAGTTLASLLTLPRTDIPAMFTAIRGLLTMSSNNCGAKGATMPIAITEWGPNTGDGGGQAELKAAFRTAKPALHTQYGGIFAAESYVNFMEQNALAVHWLELHNDSYLGNGETATPTDVPLWGYNGQRMAHQLAGAGDQLVTATLSNAGTLMSALQVHAAKKADGSVSVMVTNTSTSMAANVTVNISGGDMLNCAGTKVSYVPVSTDLSGTVKVEPIYSAAARNAFAVGVPALSVVVVTFPKP